MSVKLGLSHGREEKGLLLFENRVLKRVFGLKRDQVTAYWRRLRNEELYDVYFSPNIFHLINTRRMKWARHVAGKVHTGFWWENFRE
jgi:hypothetical protein